MNHLKEGIQTVPLKYRIVAILLLAGSIYLAHKMLNLVLLTFVFSFMFYSLTSMIVKVTRKWIRISERAILLFVYIGTLLALTLLMIAYVPVATKQIESINNTVMNFNWDQYKDHMNPKIYDKVKNVDVEGYLKDVGSYVMGMTKSVGSFLISLFLSYLLSFFLLWEKEQIKAYLKPFETGKMSFLYRYYAYFAKNFVKTFGNMIQMQISISFINSILSAIALYLFGFNQITGLAAMMFALGLIPVAGVMISLVPLSIIAYQVGGWMEIIYMLIMVAVLHAIESYVLSPKLVSSKLKMPMFFSFAALVIAEELLGIWGLLVGIPLFMFVVDFLYGKVDEASPIETISTEESTDQKS